MDKPYIPQALTQESVRHYFCYDADTGAFSRRRSVQGAPAGVGPHTRSDGYQRIRFAGGEQYVHRLAWLYVHGSLPDRIIDHIDGNPSNNRIGNLREATYAQNNQNVACYTGASLHRKTGLWRCRLQVDGREVAGTYHKTPEEAHDAYVAAKRKFHEFAVMA